MTQPYTTNNLFKMAKETQTQVIKKATLKDAFAAGIVANISVVRANDENGYLYVTMLNRAGGSNNVYFGKKTAELVEEGDKLTPEQMRDCELIIATYDDGRNPRLKISFKGESDYTDLGDIFEDVTVANDTASEVLKMLKDNMRTREQSEAEEDDDEDDDAEAAKKAAEVKAARAAKKAGK